ncbi:hypothetical protein [Alteromonas sp. S167]|uniref:hypothetical protein n=1 Tax=Alteromonas sp. S167 TaxID=3117402 RepID=UPI002FE3F48D
MKKQLTLLWAVLAIAFSMSAKAEITFPNSVYSSLDYGLYWFDYNDAKKANKGQSNPYYSSNKKTVIYIHGWQNGSVTNRNRETLNRNRSGGPNQDLAWYWLDRGYNVGILYWNQFADEREVKDAEAKIHSANGPRNMRWKSSNGSYSSGPNKSVTDLLYTALVDGMPGFSGSELRVTGHSLGNQLALTISNKLNTAVNQGSLSGAYRPDRIALLDPFYSIGEKSYLNNKWTGERSKDIVDTLKAKGIAIEAYRSSPVTSTFLAGDNNASLMNSIAFSELKPWNFQFWQVAEKHGAAVTHYFWSRAFSPLTLDRSSTQVPSASSSASVIKTWMNKNKGVIQDSGAWSATPADDDFKEKSRL